MCHPPALALGTDSQDLTTGCLSCALAFGGTSFKSWLWFEDTASSFSSLEWARGRILLRPAGFPWRVPQGAVLLCEGRGGRTFSMSRHAEDRPPSASCSAVLADETQGSCLHSLRGAGHGRIWNAGRAGSWPPSSSPTPSPGPWTTTSVCPRLPASLPHDTAFRINISGRHKIDASVKTSRSSHNAPFVGMQVLLQGKGSCNGARHPPRGPPPHPKFPESGTRSCRWYLCPCPASAPG